MQLEHAPSAETWLGLDPGLYHTGWAVAHTDNPSKALSWGCISPLPKLSLEKRLSFLGSDLEIVFQTHRPRVVVLEKTFVSVNKKDSLTLAYARGVCLMCAGRFDATVVPYAANTIKKTVTGHGHADKNHVHMMVAEHFGLNAPLSSHETDALACLLTHFSHKQIV